MLLWSTKPNYLFTTRETRVNRVTRLYNCVIHHVQGEIISLKYNEVVLFNENIINDSPSKEVNYIKRGSTSTNGQWI